MIEKICDWVIDTATRGGYLFKYKAYTEFCAAVMPLVDEAVVALKIPASQRPKWPKRQMAVMVWGCMPEAYRHCKSRSSYTCNIRELQGAGLPFLAPKAVELKMKKLWQLKAEPSMWTPPASGYESDTVKPIEFEDWKKQYLTVGVGVTGPADLRDPRECLNPPEWAKVNYAPKGADNFDPAMGHVFKPTQSGYYHVTGETNMSQAKHLIQYSPLVRVTYIYGQIAVEMTAVQLQGALTGVQQEKSRLKALTETDNAYVTSEVKKLEDAESVILSLLATKVEEQVKLDV